MITIVPETFDTQKARQLIDIYRKKRKPLKALFVYDLIYQQGYENPKDILYHDIMVKRLYTKELIESVLNDFGYILTNYISYETFGANSSHSVIAFGPDAPVADSTIAFGPRPTEG